MDLDAHHKGEVAFQGNIALIELNSIFQYFDYSSASGELRIVTEGNGASFFFRDGALIFGALRVNQKKIGDLLLESKLITEEQLTESLAIHAQSGNFTRLGNILVESGFVSFENLADILVKQAREAFFATLSWTKGKFFFYVNSHPSRQEILFNERIDRLLLEGIVRLDHTP